METTELIIKTLATQNKLLQAKVKELEGVLEKRLETNYDADIILDSDDCQGTDIMEYNCG